MPFTNIFTLLRKKERRYKLEKTIKVRKGK